MSDVDAAVVLSDPTLALVDELRAVRDQIKALKIREGKIRDRLLVELVNVSAGVTAAGVPVVTVDRDDRSRIDRDRLQALYPDVWADCQTSSLVQTVRLPETV